MDEMDDPNLISPQKLVDIPCIGVSHSKVWTSPFSQLVGFSPESTMSFTLDSPIGCNQLDDGIFSPSIFSPYEKNSGKYEKKTESCGNHIGGDQSHMFTMNGIQVENFNL